MEHFLSGLNQAEGWPASSSAPVERPSSPSHEFAVGTNSFQLIPLSTSGSSGAVVDTSSSRGNTSCIKELTSDGSSPFGITHLDVSAAAKAAVAKIMPGSSSTAIAAKVLKRVMADQHLNHLDQPTKKRKVVDSKSWTCEICGKVLSRSDKLRNHMKLHTQRLAKIPSTNKTSVGSSTPSDATAEPKASTCKICGKILSRGDKLRDHMKIHANDYPYNCEICGHGFLRAEGLKIHTRIHTGERPYVCEICGKSYTRKDKLTRHAIVHTGQRPFACDNCGKAFARKDKLHRHKLTHADKEYACSLCHVEFSRQDVFNNHIERKHPELLKKLTETYTCPKCVMEFPSQEQYLKHFEINHPEIFYTLASEVGVTENIGSESAELRSYMSQSSGTPAPSENMMILPSTN